MSPSRGGDLSRPANAEGVPRYSVSRCDGIPLIARPGKIGGRTLSTLMKLVPTSRPVRRWTKVKALLSGPLHRQSESRFAHYTILTRPNARERGTVYRR
ncbi:hypothetical protein MRX96_031039 [Rhipicephalus microplus]